MSVDLVKRVVEPLGIEDIPKSWVVLWSKSDQSYTEAKLDFLDAGFVKDAAELIKLSASVVDALLQSANTVAANRNLHRLAWHARCELVGNSGLIEKNPKIWPLPIERHGGEALVYALVFLSTVPRLRQHYQELSIPESVFLDTLDDFERYIHAYRDEYGHWGFRRIDWHYWHFSGNLFRLGRLQFAKFEFNKPLRVFAQIGSKRRILLADEHLEFHSNGLFADAVELGPHDQTFMTAYSVNGSEVSGNPINSQGLCEDCVVRLSTDVWRECLAYKDSVLDVHIPAIGPMGYEDCLASFQQAIDFFKQYFPEFPFKAFVCRSWLLDGQLENYLPSASNLVRFLKLFHLHPLPGQNSHKILNRVLGTRDVANAPSRTTLQKAVIKHLEFGGQWYYTGGILFPDEL